ncbi:MAG: DMT family transporter [Myxococcota bacterium]
MSSTGKGALLALSSALCAAVFLIPYKAAGALVTRDAAVLAMLLCAAVFNTLTTVSLHRGSLALNRVTVVAAAALAVLTAIGNVAVGEALAQLSAGVTSVLQQTQVLFVAAMASIVLGERITVRFVIGATVALCGFALINLPGSEAGSEDNVRLAGMLWAVASAVAFGAMHVITRKVIHRVQPVLLNAMRLWLAVLLLAALPGRVPAVLDMDVRPWLLCLAAAGAGPFIGRVCIMYSVRYIPASQSTLLGLVSPVFAFILGFVFFSATPGLFDLLGTLLITVGVAVPVAELAAQAQPIPTSAERRQSPRSTSQP